MPLPQRLPQHPEHQTRQPVPVAIQPSAYARSNRGARRGPILRGSKVLWRGKKIRQITPVERRRTSIIVHGYSFRQNSVSDKAGGQLLLITGTQFPNCSEDSQRFARARQQCAPSATAILAQTHSPRDLDDDTAGVGVDADPGNNHNGTSAGASI